MGDPKYVKVPFSEFTELVKAKTERDLIIRMFAKGGGQGWKLEDLLTALAKLNNVPIEKEDGDA